MQLCWLPNEALVLELVVLSVLRDFEVVKNKVMLLSVKCCCFV